MPRTPSLPELSNPAQVPHPGVSIGMGKNAKFATTIGVSVPPTKDVTNVLVDTAYTLKTQILGVRNVIVQESKAAASKIMKKMP